MANTSPIRYKGQAYQWNAHGENEIVQITQSDYEPPGGYEANINFQYPEFPWHTIVLHCYPTCDNCAINKTTKGSIEGAVPIDKIPKGP